MNFQAVVTTVKTFNEFVDKIKFVQNLSSACSTIGIVYDSCRWQFFEVTYRWNRCCEQPFLFTEAASIPKDVQGNFAGRIRHTRNKAALDSFLEVSCWRMWWCDIFISWSREVKCNYTDFSEDFHIGRTQEEPVTKIIVDMKYYPLIDCWNIIHSLVAELL